MAKKKKAIKPQREFTRRQLSHLQKQKRRQRIIFFGGISIIAAVVLIVLIGWIMADYVPLHKTVLKVNDTEFDASYYIDVLKIAGTNQQSSNLQTLASSVAQQIAQDELIKQGAEKLGITVNDEETKRTLQNMNVPVSDGSIGLFRSQLLQNRLKEEYFGPQVPESEKQVHAMIMMVESEKKALEVINSLQSGDNFTALSGEYAQNYYSKNVNEGDFGWHPESILEEQLGSHIPVEYAFSAAAGSLSEPLYDEESYKQVGYWLLRVNDKPDADSANVSALLISNNELAETIRARLEAGEDLGPIADEYSNYSPSQDKHGELGLMVQSDNISNAFNGYVFSPETELGKWSEPIYESQYWTQGGYWVVNVVDTAEDRKLSDDDRNYLIGKLFDDWVSRLWSDPGNNIDDSYLTDELTQWAVEQALKDLQGAGSNGN
ncbi:MAG TPA: peptidylprolyl isomerase [Dehalococcoidales bacterium]|nr:peptidylprolyl isomerase [Dehalococcoidales bacterium]